ncbi:MAG: phage tail protein [Prolixibacteraceae bacterium]|jgi:phage tail-like protein|nr:phage tail protein [Prolixibacteraceae bacterium]MBT6004569.1 phage tail protein [Prolixibacteraceae bacterium]MBT6767037.1 phage tail protein [Prolixibacteraceae bacterium]MBT6996978.1 phage tail protein [Prolixibacteraceae bacterium]MBT7394242.1 phage tail protein [Prolixibacteraceae bacterium]
MAEYPLPKFHFKVTFGDAEFNCTEVSGLDFEREIIEYRAGADSEYHKTKQPGLSKYANITVKRGTFKTTKTQWYEKWVKTVYFQEGEEQYRGDLTISLLDENHEPMVTWKAVQAFITKIQSTDLKADGNEIAIETAEFVHEKLELLT